MDTQSIGFLALIKQPSEGDVNIYNIAFVAKHSQFDTSRPNSVGIIKCSHSQEVFFLHEIKLRPDFQRRGMASKVVYMAIEKRFNCKYIMFLTQSSHMLKAMKPLCTDIFPEQSTIPPKEVTEQISNYFGAHDHELPVIKGYFRQQQLEVIPKNSTQKFWSKSCKYEMGDAVICIGHFTSEVMSGRYPYYI